MINYIKRKKRLWQFLFIGIIVCVLIELIPTNPVMAEAATDMPKQNSDMIPFYWIILIVGGCIAITLSYVSWRKYKGEEKKKLDKDKTVD